MATMPDRLDEHSVTDRLAAELHEAAAAARHGGQAELARDLDDRADVLAWASSLSRTSDAAGPRVRAR